MSSKIVKQIDPDAAPDFWRDWILFKAHEHTNMTLQLKKQGAVFRDEQFVHFTYRPNVRCPPSVQEFYEAIINGINKRKELLLYQGDHFWYSELQSALHEFLKLLEYKVDKLIEIFQVLTNLNLTKEVQPNIVVPCAFCATNVCIGIHCKQCFSAFYCDKTCIKNHKLSHESECNKMKRMTPSIIYPLQVEVHCGGDMCEDIEIYFEHEMKFSLKLRGQKFMDHLLKMLGKNRWLRSNFYQIQENKEKNYIKLAYTQKDKDDEPKDFPMYDTNVQGEQDLYLRMPAMQEIKVLL
jgi:hypothetical protein